MVAVICGLVGGSLFCLGYYFGATRMIERMARLGKRTPRADELPIAPLSQDEEDDIQKRSF